MGFANRDAQTTTAMVICRCKGSGIRGAAPRRWARAGRAPARRVRSGQVRSGQVRSKSRVQTRMDMKGACLPPNSMMMTRAPTSLVDGSGQRPELSTTSVTGPSVASSTQHRPPCLTPKLAHMQRASVQLAPLRLSSASRRPFLGRCFSGDCVCRCPLHLQLADAVVAWTCLVTMSRHARAQGYCVPVAGPSSEQQPVFAAKQEPLSSDLNVEPRRPNERRSRR